MELSILVLMRWFNKIPEEEVGPGIPITTVEKGRWWEDIVMFWGPLVCHVEMDVYTLTGVL